MFMPMFNKTDRVEFWISGPGMGFLLVLTFTSGFGPGQGDICGQTQVERDGG